MEVSDKMTSVTIENNGFPSCNQKIGVGKESSVQIGFTTEDGSIGWGSGNYMKLGKYKFVITAAHVVDEDNIFILDEDEVVPLKVLYRNVARDIAIVIPDEELTISPRHLKINQSATLEGVKVNYTGYPSDIGKSIYTGIVSKSTENIVIVQGFALPGSSGSVVFDNKGRAVGIVSAVKLFQSPFSPFPELVETLVYVERVNFIDKKFLKEVFMSAKKGR
tara:strand:+ start:247 stop:906 length:660 start_codon:yes stop_codon:yes gene_type:complete